MIAPMRWCAPALEEAFEDLCLKLRGAAWPQPPDGYALVTLPRPMRLVLRGSWPAPPRAQNTRGPPSPPRLLHWDPARHAH